MEDIFVKLKIITSLSKLILRYLTKSQINLLYIKNQEKYVQ